MATEGRLGFRPIIVGGSIAGLTLANAFEKAGIDYILLEGRDKIAPNLGTFLVIFPNGATILDQLGIYKNMDLVRSPLKDLTIWTGPGKSSPTKNIWQVLQARLGYGCYIVERQPLIQTLYDSLLKKQNIHVNKKVKAVVQTEKGVVIQCQDGSEYHGDIVIGADGIRSTIRKEMHKLTAKEGQPITKDAEAMTAEYDVIYGISSAMQGFKPGSMHRSMAKDHSSLVFVCNDGRLCWGFMTKMDKQYPEKDIPRRDSSQSDAHIQKYSDFEVGCNTKLSEVWENVEGSSFVTLEEAFMESWSYGRMVCVGDSVHKATANAGQGGNMAIESAAALANSIVKMLDTTPSKGDVSDKNIKEAFQSYQKVRQQRTKAITDISNNMCRSETYATFTKKVFTVWIEPMMSDFITNLVSKFNSSGPTLEFLPLPKTRTQANYQWKLPKKIKDETRLRRILVGLPLLFVFYGATKTIGATSTHMLPLLMKASASNLFEVDDGRSIQIPSKIFGTGIDKLIKALVAFFLPSLAGTDPAGRLQAIAFLADVSAVINIILIEGIRTGNAFTAAKAPFLALIMSQLRGAGIVMPIYYFLHYLTTPPKNFAATDHRMTNMAYAKTLLPTVTIAYTVPTAAMYFYPNIMVRQHINGIWQLFPVWLSLIHILLSYCVKDTTVEKRVENPKADIQYLRNAYLLTGLTSASVYLFLWAESPYSMKEIFFSALANPGKAEAFIAPASAKFLRYDYICMFGGGLYWTGLQFWDLKRAQRTTTSWFRFLGAMTAGVVSLGPGAAMAGFWYWREKVLGRKVA